MSIVVPPSPEVRITNRVYTTLVEMVYVWRGRRLTVPADYPTDLASIPRLIRPIFPTISEARAKGSIGHDRLYEKRHWDSGEAVTRAEADRFMFDVCVAEGMPVILALWIRWGLFLGSWWAWGRWRMTWKGPRRGA